ncbi:hypothetical protein OSB04_un000659 [Centaurea solstitialis]|uniref:Reverse transcriptase Ty1/copia-type domain-containing protein n=1 Tax=Centaurea solstitialis TaxID=347529 RepID=A0AA38S5G1_9ASTR|nr:hypothetical protein OSB04_un000659 [Centaurea solstitialis]
MVFSWTRSYWASLLLRALGCYKWYQSRSLYHRDGGANLIGNDESSRGDVGNILGKSHIAEDKERKILGRPDEDLDSKLLGQSVASGFGVLQMVSKPILVPSGWWGKPHRNDESSRGDVGNILGKSHIAEDKERKILGRPDEDSRSLYHRYGGANLIGNDESSRGDVGNILGKSHIAEDKERKILGRPDEDVRSSSGGVCDNPSHMDRCWTRSYWASLLLRALGCYRPGLDYIETFSPVVKPATLHLILSLVSSKNWPLRQLDIYNAFLQGTLTESVYMSQPHGFVDPLLPYHVCQLNKAIYGLRQVSRAWYE